MWNLSYVENEPMYLGPTEEEAANKDRKSGKSLRRQQTRKLLRQGSGHRSMFAKADFSSPQFSSDAHYSPQPVPDVIPDVKPEVLRSSGQEPEVLESQELQDEIPTWDEFTQTTTFHGVRYIFNNKTPFKLRRFVNFCVSDQEQHGQKLQSCPAVASFAQDKKTL